MVDTMLLILILAILAWLLSSLFTPIVVSFAHRLGIVDRPDETRKLHKGPVPRLGGIAVAVAYVLSLQILRFAPNGSAAEAGTALTLTGHLLPGVLLVFVIGLYDDVYGLRPLQKVGVELVASVMVYLMGVRVMVVDNQATGPWWSFFITVLWLIVCTNAVNLIDGLDGLATGVGICASFVTMMAALWRGDLPLALVTVPLVGSLVGFLRYNFAPAKIFLGDCGSLTIGFLLGCCGIVWGHKSATLFGMLAPVLALSIPLLDTSVSILRRLLGGRPVFAGDRGHIHHRLLDRGLTPVRVALFLYLACAGCAVAAACIEVSSLRLITLLTFGTFTLLGIRYLDYAEFSAAGRVIRRGALLRLLRTEIILRALERDFEDARTPDECWHVLKRFYHQFGFCSLSCCIGGNVYRDSKSDNQMVWSLRIPLANGDYMEFHRDSHQLQEHHSVETLVNSVLGILAQKMVWSSWVQFSGAPSTKAQIGSTPGRHAIAIGGADAQRL